MRAVHDLEYNKVYRRKLRREMTKAEVYLWQRIRNNQLGYKFRRQHGIGRFIVDFYCPEKTLAIEVDGITHESEEVQRKDAEKEAYIKAIGASVVRYTDAEVLGNIDGVLEDLTHRLGSHFNSSP